MKNNYIPSGVILYAKQSGLTSFASLWSIKHALGTDKVGHTGTLDSFADGLLVVLSGSLTHIVPHITGFTKTYLALVCFGRETDTLDPTGQVIKTGNAVTRSQVEKALEKFRGPLLQTPPMYSALHVDGKRLSDMARDGKEVHIEPRQIFVYENSLLDFKEATEQDPCSYAVLKIVCSKGTYIRSIARDIGESLGSCAHLRALRRTQVGPFRLEDSACYGELKEFTLENGIASGMAAEKLAADDKARQEEKKLMDGKRHKKEKTERKSDSPEKVSHIRDHFIPVCPELMTKCGFYVDRIKKEAVSSYTNGRPLYSKMFERVASPDQDSVRSAKKEIAVFYQDDSFAGMMCLNEDNRLRYSFVVPPVKKNFEVFTWDQVIAGDFPVIWVKKGTALTVGKFETVHKGHKELINAVYDQKKLVPGVVTFSGSQDYVFTLEQRLNFIRDLGMEFAIVADFTKEFASLEGEEFINVLVKQCGMKFLAEGRDFKCGSGGKTDMSSLLEMAKIYDFELKECADVDFEGAKISSSRIAAEIEKGEFIRVSKMLERPFDPLA